MKYLTTMSNSIKLKKLQSKSVGVDPFVAIFLDYRHWSVINTNKKDVLGRVYTVNIFIIRVSAASSYQITKSV